MKTVRNSVFETNSSSMHAIVIPKASFRIDNPVDVCMDASMDFSERTLIERANPDEKASYCFHLILDHWNSKFKRGQWSDKLRGYEDISDDEVKRNEQVIAAYRKFIAYMKKSLKTHWKVKLKIKNVSVVCGKKGACLSFRGYNGCYGHAALKSILMSNLIGTIDKIAEPGADLSVLDKSETTCSWVYFYDLVYFILDPNAVIIQNTDECTNRELKQMQSMILKYVKKNKGMCYVDWPFGG